MMGMNNTSIDGLFEDRGSLLTIEPDDYRTKRERTYKYVLYIISIIIPILFLFIIVIYSPYEYAVLFLGIPAVIGPLVVQFLIRDIRIEPIKFYENGFEIQNFAGVRAFFYYEGLEGTIKFIIGKKYITIYRRQKFRVVPILSTPIWPELDNLLPDILGKLGSKSEENRFKVVVENPEEYSKTYSKMFIGVFVLLTAFTLLISLTIFMDYGGISLIAASIFASYIFMRLLMIFVSNPARVFGMAPKIDKKYVMIALLIVIILVVGSYAIPVKLAIIDDAIKDLNFTKIIDNSIMDKVFTLNRTICFKGNITLKDVIFNITVSDVGIVIAKESTVVMENVSVLGRPWKFESYGKLIVKNSYFEGMWGDKNHTNLQGGMEIYGEAEFINCTFSNAITNALMIYRVNATIENCFFNNTGDEGVESNGGKLYIKNTKFIRCQWAITTFVSNVHIANCSFENCEHGICLTDASTGDIKNAIFNNCRIAIEISYGGSAKIDNVIYKNCNIEYLDKSRAYNTICLTFILPVIVPMLLYGIYIIKKHSRESFVYDMIKY